MCECVGLYGNVCDLSVRPFDGIIRINEREKESALYECIV